jgi:adenylate kinase family enzyme
MKPITCIFFGKSGSGKGTQAELVLKNLKEVDKNNKTIYLETGRRFREFTDSNDSFTSLKVKKGIQAGQLIPAFFPIWIWSSVLVDEVVTGKEHMILDGLSRRPEEAPILDSALKFYERENILVLFLDIHHNIAKDRLLKRGRHDDKHEEIDKRLSWFDNQVMKSVDYFKNNSHYNFITINGDQTIENVHKDICKALKI